MSNLFQKTIDSWWSKTLFRFIPRSITPNFFTFLRFFLIPVVLYFLAIGAFGWSLLAFAIAALADTVDGSLARTRNQISSYGSMLDPMADKMLIILLSLFLLYYYPFTILLLIVIALDVMLALEGLFFVMITRGNKAPASNWTGKSKMVFQVLGLIIIMIYLMTNSLFLLSLSIVLLELAVFTGVISFINYGLRSWKLSRKLKK